MPTPRNTTLRNKHRAYLSRTRPACHLCGEPIDYTLKHTHPRHFVVDHIIPLNRGGTDTLSNVAAAHADCNRRKSDNIISPVPKRSGSLR